MRTLALVLLSFVVPQIALAAQPAGSCLSQKQTRKVGKAKSAEERLGLLAEIARKQGRELWDHVARYRRWTQTGKGWVPPPTTEQILDLHDCALRAMLEQMNSWRVRAPDWRKQVESVSADIEESYESLKVAKCLAEMRGPELVPRIQASVELLEEVQGKIEGVLAGTPASGSSGQTPSSADNAPLLVRSEIVLSSDDSDSLDWSPDGKKLVVAHGLELWIHDAVSGERTRLLYAPSREGGFGASISGVSWGGPRGEVAFSGGLEDAQHVFILSQDGEQVLPPLEGFAPQWLGRGGRLVYQCGSPLYWMESKVCVFDVETQEVRELVKGINVVAVDGNTVAYRRVEPAGDGGVWLLNVDTIEERRLTRDPMDEPMAIVSGQFVVFNRRENGVWAVDVRSGVEKKVLAERCAGGRVSPSGQVLLCWVRDTSDGWSHELVRFRVEIR